MFNSRHRKGSPCPTSSCQPSIDPILERVSNKKEVWTPHQVYEFVDAAVDFFLELQEQSKSICQNCGIYNQISPEMEHQIPPACTIEHLSADISSENDKGADTVCLGEDVDVCKGKDNIQSNVVQASAGQEDIIEGRIVHLKNQIDPEDGTDNIIKKGIQTSEPLPQGEPCEIIESVLKDLEENKKDEDKEDVVCQIYDPFYVDDNEWSVPANVSYVSNFMQKNKRYVKTLPQNFLVVADYIFHNHRNMVDSNVFASGGKFFIDFRNMQSLSSGMLISSFILDVWALLLSQLERHKASTESRDMKKFYFNTSHLVFLDQVYNLTLEVDLLSADEKKTSELQKKHEELIRIKQKWRDTMKYTFVKKSCYADSKFGDVFFIPIHCDLHYYMAVIDFQNKVVYYVDNIPHVDLEETKHWKLVQLLQMEIADFLSAAGHPEAAHVAAFPLCNLKFDWHEARGGVDCGVFVMHAMKYFVGCSYTCPDLLTVQTRRKLRAEFCASIILSRSNELRLNTFQDVLKFLAKSKAKK